MSQSIEKIKSTIWPAGWLFVVMFVYPIPHTIALRNVLLAAGLALLVPHLSRMKRLSALRNEAFLLGALSAWLLIQSAFISPYPQTSLANLRGDWMVGLAVALVGLLLALRLADSREVPGASANGAITVVVLALLAHVAFALGEQVWIWVQSGVFPFGHARFGNRDNLSVLNNTLLALVIGDLMSRSVLGSGAVRLPQWAMWAAFVTGLVATITLATRNGTLQVVFFLVLSAALLTLKGGRQWRRRGLSLSAMVAVLAIAFGYISIQTDSRWHRFAETVDIALDTQTHRHWLNSERYPLPHTGKGEYVEESAYLRIAWLKEGLRQIARHPLGVGYDHQAFGAALRLEVAEPITAGASHNGLIEFTIANGIPGIILWTALNVALVIRGWRSFVNGGNPAGMLLVMNVICYFSRCALDGHLSGHRLEMFMLITALLAASCAMQGSVRQTLRQQRAGIAASI